MLAATLTSLALLTQLDTGPLDLDQLRSEAERQLEDPTAPGLSLAIARSGEIEDVIVLGLADTASARAVETGDAFRSASTLKMVVAAAILRQARISGHDLHGPIGTIAPDLPAFLHEITLHQLLTHTAGLVDRTNDFGRLDPAALRDAVLALPEDIRFLEPGTAFSYSNIGYNIAGYVLERMSEEPFADAMERLILSPLDMASSTFDTQAAQTNGWAAPHWQGRALDRNPENAAEWPSGMMYTSASDMAAFLTAMLNDGVVAGERVWPAGLSGLLTAPHVPESDTATGFGYGYGVMLGEFAGRDAWFHSGGLPGYRANALALPESNLAIALLTNGEGFDRTALLNALVPSTPPLPRTGPSAAGDLELSDINPDTILGHYVQADDLPSLCVYERGGAAYIDSRGTALRLQRSGPTSLVGVNSDGEVLARYRLHTDTHGTVQAMSSWVRAFRRTQNACG